MRRRDRIQHNVQCRANRHHPQAGQVLPEGEFKPRRRAAFALRTLGDFGTHHVQLDVPALPHQAAKQPAPAKPVQRAVGPRFAHHDLGDILLAGHAQQAAGNIGIGCRNDFRAQFTRQRQMLGQPLLGLRRQRLR